MEVHIERWIFLSFLLIVFVCLINYTQADEDVSEESNNKRGRFLSMFEIINFPNDACTGDDKNGTCYTSQECDDKNGKKDGDCADGFGVCCTFEAKCGDKSSENNTYFTSSGTETSGACAITVCPGENICQLRLDFDSFVINGPYTSTLTTEGTTKVLWGQVQTSTLGAEALMLHSQCYLDSFSVTSPSGQAPPVICGTNSGEHMYVDATASYCNTLGFALGSGSGISRSWQVRVSQYECDYNNLAPSGCTQYFFGQSTGYFMSYNYQSGSGYNLADQNQNICFRREKGNTKICYTTSIFTDFQVSQGANEKGNVGIATSCCGYGDDGMKAGIDCLMIPSAKKADLTNLPKGAGGFCGNGGLVTSNDKDSTKSATICSQRTPFMVRFLTDNFEWKANEGSVQKGTKGFKLAYILG